MRYDLAKNAAQAAEKPQGGQDGADGADGEATEMEKRHQVPAAGGSARELEAAQESTGDENLSADSTKAATRAPVLDEDTPLLKYAPALKDGHFAQGVESSSFQSDSAVSGNSANDAKQAEVQGVDKTPKTAAIAAPATAVQSATAPDDPAAAALSAVWRSLKEAALDAAKEALNPCPPRPHVSSMVASLEQETGRSKVVQ